MRAHEAAFVGRARRLLPLPHAAGLLTSKQNNVVIVPSEEAAEVRFDSRCVRLQGGRRGEVQLHGLTETLNVMGSCPAEIFAPANPRFLNPCRYSAVLPSWSFSFPFERKIVVWNCCSHLTTTVDLTTTVHLTSPFHRIL